MNVIRIGWLLGATSIVTATLVAAACSSSSESTGGGGGSDDAALGRDVASSEDAAISPADAGTDTFVPPSDASTRDANGVGEAGADCSFNSDCQAALRCECNETTGCACKPGVRGTGRNGIDPCASGNACASAVCVEGPADAGFFCSDECKTSMDCTGKLPLCSTIAFVGRICIRTRGTP